MRDALDDLWPENADAWRVFGRVATRFVVDLHLGNEALRRMTDAVADADAYADLLGRLSLIYDYLYPPPPKAVTL